MIPLQILIGASDDWTPAAPCLELAERVRAAGGPMEIVAYDGAFHDFDAPNVPTRIRKNVATTPTGTATVGTNEEARRAAIERVEWLLRDALVR